MMIKPPSSQKQYDEFFSEDAAFRQLNEGASKEEIEEYNHARTVAWETGDWTAMRVQGAGEPTKFIVRPIPGEAFAKLADMATAGRIGDLELYTLAFRIALVAVLNLEGAAKVSFVEDERFGRIASLSFLADAGITGALAVRVLREIGSRVLQRAGTFSPKS